MSALVIENLTKVYDNNLKALNNVSFRVERGDFFALLGRNGAGKSTLISILSSLLKKSSGKVSILGHDIDHDFAKAKMAIGLVPQEINCNVFVRVSQVLVSQAGYYGIPKAQALPRIETYLKKLGLWDKRDSKVRELSGGMKRRLLIARALIHEPSILILDEPTAGVDIELRRMMWDFLTEINEKGVTIILTTHYLEEAEHLCRNIAIIDRGSLIAHFPMVSLLEKIETEHFILYVDEKLSALPELDGYHFWKVDDYTLEVEVSRVLGLTHLFAQLEQLNIKVVSMRNKANRLEELFLRLTSEV